MTNDGLKQTVVARHDRSSQIVRLPQAGRDRIAQIAFTLLFKGEAVRANLVDRFCIAAAQAMKDFTMYRAPLLLATLSMTKSSNSISAVKHLNPCVTELSEKVGIGISYRSMMNYLNTERDTNVDALVKIHKASEVSMHPDLDEKAISEKEEKMIACYRNVSDNVKDAISILLNELNN